MNFIKLTRRDGIKILINLDCVSMVADERTGDKVGATLFFIERNDSVEVLESMESITGLMTMQPIYTVT